MCIAKNEPVYYVGTDEYNRVREKLSKLHQKHTITELARRDSFWVGRLGRLSRGKGRMSKSILDEIDSYLDLYIMTQ